MILDFNSQFLTNNRGISTWTPLTTGYIRDAIQGYQYGNLIPIGTQDTDVGAKRSG